MAEEEERGKKGVGSRRNCEARLPLLCQALTKDGRREGEERGFLTEMQLFCQRVRLDGTLKIPDSSIAD